MRDRLIKLLDNKISTLELEDCDSIWTSEKLDELADYLLENGIIILPCKLGTKIYHIDLEIPEEEPQCSDCKENHSGFGDFWCDKDYIGWPTFEDMLNDPKDICPKFKPFMREETFTLSFWASHEKWFNKSWFLTEDEANKTLIEFNKNN